MGDKLYTLPLVNINVPFHCSHCHKVGHILAGCDFDFRKKFHGDAKSATEVRTVNSNDNHGARAPALEHPSPSLGVGGSKGQFNGSTKMGAKNDFCVGDIPIQVDEDDVSSKVEGRAHLDFFGDDLDLSMEKVRSSLEQQRNHNSGFK